MVLEAPRAPHRTTWPHSPDGTARGFSARCKLVGWDRTRQWGRGLEVGVPLGAPKYKHLSKFRSTAEGSESTGAPRRKSADGGHCRFRTACARGVLSARSTPD